jgi:hypothetical protein
MPKIDSGHATSDANSALTGRFSRSAAMTRAVVET